VSAVRCDEVAQKFHLLDSPDAFGGVEAEPVAVEAAEDLVEMTD
jgi:hypothetical protein